ncbi:putative peptidase [Streptomyces sp. NBRC 110611]|uniref:S1 family peptidase n=1 Tax=Streptomyces sp. NBRC 110611 TaxID=1621259 RepID=UPI000831A3CE|nr:S1 family peptidase [Streptomyces sp. NBRC 110611]GAU66304.1 putative peptidase [Streptomyces sp. NBRC 110611]
MKHRRIPKRRVLIAGAGALALAATGTLTLASAHAAPAPTTARLTPAAATALASQLDPGTAGAFYDARAGKLVVNVVDEAAARTVRAKGAEARIVNHTRAQLDAARQTLKAKATIPGTSWSMDPRTNKVVVTADRTVEGDRLDRLTKVVGSLGDKAELRRTKGEFRRFIAGGDAIWGDSARCSLGFNVVKGGQPYFLTAGHCGNAVKSWSDQQGGQEIATTEESSFPGNDYAIAKYTGDTAHPSEVNTYSGSPQKITKAAEATVGEKVQRSGSTTQLHDGSVKALNATVNYQEGTVEGLIQTDVCAEPGDSGGALFDGESALGLTSGGSGDCSGGGETFFQPVPEALQAYGAEIG